jgi:hypothetical protein
MTAAPPSGLKPYGGLARSSITTCSTPFTCLASASSQVFNAAPITGGTLDGRIDHAGHARVDTEHRLGP